MRKNKNSRKIFNDPIYGFVSIPDELVFRLIEHPWFQRLRRIKQLGQTQLVYPGALHTRFHHALGAMHLMQQAVEVLRSKKHNITKEEAQAAYIAILLHDIGHGPFSHSLENSIVHKINHEHLSILFMERLNKEFKGKLSLAIRIFSGTYRKKFLHQLVSSQLDVDRLDYLTRDSFYTGVSEGIVSTARIVKMLNVVNNELVVESKGIYSIENFILSRRLMYWQVYLHKTVLSAEKLMVNILRRARDLARGDQELFASPAFRFFLYNRYDKHAFYEKEELLEMFALLDDPDITTSIKVWTKHPDGVLSDLCTRLINRRLFRLELSDKPFPEEKILQLKRMAKKKFSLQDELLGYYVFSDEVSNDTYRVDKIRINILYPGGRQVDIADASDQFNEGVLAKTVKKYFLCYPKELGAWS